jgi:hypothetical protein
MRTGLALDHAALDILESDGVGSEWWRLVETQRRGGVFSDWPAADRIAAHSCGEDVSLSLVSCPRYILNN